MCFSHSHLSLCLEKMDPRSEVCCLDAAVLSQGAAGSFQVRLKQMQATKRCEVGTLESPRSKISSSSKFKELPNIYTQTYVLFKNIMLPYWPKDNAGLARLTKWECKEHNHPLSSLSSSAFMSWIVRWWFVVCFARQSEVGCKTVDDLDFKQTPRCAFTVFGFFWCFHDVFSLL